jgi:membrane protein required for colicin V production
MTVYDIVILAVIGFFAIWGLWRGIIREVFDVTGLVVGILAARHFAPMLGAKIPPKAVALPTKTIILSVIILILVWLIIRIIGALIRKVVCHGPVKPLDRLGGFLVGIIKGALLILALAILVAITPLGDILSAPNKNSPVLSVTMRIARPLAERYRKALGSSLTKNINDALANMLENIKSENLPDSAKSDAKQAFVSGMSGVELTSLKISLDTLSPEADRVIQEILRDKKFMGLSAGLLYKKLKESGTVIDIDLKQLSPEARQAALLVMQNPTLTGVNIDSVCSKTGVDLKKLAQQLNSPTGN